MNDGARAPEGREADHRAVSHRQNEGPFDRAPALTWLAVVAGLVDLLFNRVLVRGLSASLPHPALVDLARWGALPRNLAAVAGLVALSLAVFGFLRFGQLWPPIRLGPRGPGGPNEDAQDVDKGLSLFRRVGIAAFAGVFLPTIALATVLPPERTTPHVILFSTGAANVLAVLMGSGAARRTSPPGLRVAVALASAAAFFALGSLVVGLVGPQLRWDAAARTAGALRHLGEIAFLLTAPALAFSVFPRRGEPRRRLALAAGLSAALAAAALFLLGTSTARPDLDVLVYGAARVELLLGLSPLFYAVPFGIAFGVGTAATLSPRPAVRQAGCGLLLLYAAGYAPRAAGQLLAMVLALALLARSAMAHAARQSQPNRSDRELPTPATDTA